MRKEEPEVEDVLTSTLKKVTRENSEEVVEKLEAVHRELREIKNLLEGRG